MRMRIGSAVAAVAVTALAGGALAQAASKTVPVKAGSYSGTSSESAAVTFSITGRAIGKFKTTIGYNGKCGQGGGPGFTILANGVAIASNGTFSKKITLVGPVKSVPNHSGKLTGKVSGTTVTGSIIDETLNKPGQCNGYTETFSASLK
jgi:hypothetical protein